MKENNNFVFVVLDALRSDHVNEDYMPFLDSLKGSSIFVESLNVSSGFCERSEIMFGLYPHESGFVHAISVNSSSKPYAWLPSLLANFFAKLELNPVMVKIVRRILWKLSEYAGNPMYPQRIPIRFLHKVGFTEDAVDFEEYSHKIQRGLLYEVMNLGYEVDWKFFTSLSSSKTALSDSDRFYEIPGQLQKSRNQFLPVYIGHPDEFGHKFGPHSVGLIKELKGLDRKIEEFYGRCLSADPFVKICFIGDHGMEKVSRVVDLKREIYSIASQMKLSESDDYDIFIDSTSVRIWLYGEKAKMERFGSFITENEVFNNHGVFLNDALCRHENLPNVRDLADIVWWATKGVQVAPDYFHDERVGKAGMHGYLRSDNTSSGFVICTASDLVPSYASKCECHELARLLVN